MSLDGIGYRIACSIHFNTPWCSGFGLSDCWVKQKDYVASRLRRDLDTWRLRNNPLPTLSRITLVHMQLHSIQDVKICLVLCNTAIHHTVLSTYSRLLMQVKLYTYYLIQDFQNPLLFTAVPQGSWPQPAVQCPGRCHDESRLLPLKSNMGGNGSTVNIMNPGIMIYRD